MPGFIHDKLEIKFLILYITARVIEPIPFDTVWDLAMCDEGVDYFDFAECLSDLVRTEHLTLSADGLYAITIFTAALPGNIWNTSFMWRTLGWSRLGNFRYST